jgi:hypothetical protein
MSYGQRAILPLSLTTQGPAYPPSELMDEHGRFIVIGRVFEQRQGEVVSAWKEAIVSARSPLPPFGEFAAYEIVRALAAADDDLVLHTLPLPLPCNNYPMLFAPEQLAEANVVSRRSLPLHAAHIPDLRPGDGRKVTEPITLGRWRRASGEVVITIAGDGRSASFEFAFAGLIPDSLYTVMALREHDLDPRGPTRPGPLGVPNVCIADASGNATYRARMPNPFPRRDAPGANRIVNVILLWMSAQTSHGGAIGLHGLGGDIHAQLKLSSLLTDFETRD